MPKPSEAADIKARDMLINRCVSQISHFPRDEWQDIVFDIGAGLERVRLCSDAPLPLRNGEVKE